MTYTISPSKDGAYIVLEVKGEINRRTAMALNLEAHALGRELGIDRYLMDVTQARNTDSAVASYRFAYSDMREAKGIDRNARVAILVSEDDHSHDFIETVVRNAGLSVRLFTDPDQAKAFLADS